MKLISKNQEVIESRREDGTIVQTVTRWRGTILTDLGAVVYFDFDHNPSDDDLTALSPTPTLVDITPTTKAGLRTVLEERIHDAQSWDWFNTKLQGDASVPAPAKTALAAMAQQQYNRAKQAAIAWFQAPP